MASPAKKTGKVKSYDSTKNKGVILSGKQQYHFFTSDLVYEIDADNLRKGVEVVFVAEGKSKPVASEIEISDSASAVRYELPEGFKHTRELGFDEWQTIEISKQPISVRSSEGHEQALSRLIEKAKAVKANALIDLKKIKSKKSPDEPYVCKAQFAVIGKVSPRGDYARVDLLGLNERLKKRSTGNNKIYLFAGLAVGLAVLIVTALIFILK